MNQLNDIARLYKNGYKKKEIADKLGISVGAVIYAIRKMRKEGKIVERWWKENGTCQSSEPLQHGWTEGVH